MVVSAALVHQDLVSTRENLSKHGIPLDEAFAGGDIRKAICVYLIVIHRKKKGDVSVIARQMPALVSESRMAACLTGRTNDRLMPVRHSLHPAQTPHRDHMSSSERVHMPACTFHVQCTF